MIDRTEAGRSIDVLGEILETIRLQVLEVQVAQCDAELPINITVEHGYVIIVALRGCLRADLGSKRLELGAGDAIAVARSAQTESLTVEIPHGSGANPRQLASSPQTCEKQESAMSPSPALTPRSHESPLGHGTQSLDAAASLPLGAMHSASELGVWESRQREARAAELSATGWAIQGATEAGAPERGEQTSILRCNCRFDDADRHPLLGALPPVIHVQRHQWTDVTWLKPTIDWILREIGTEHDGSKAIANRLLELLWMQLIRAHLASTGIASRGWLRALSDAQIGEALGIIHDQPGMRFTVSSLAHAVGMSRSAFACQFTRLVGEPPLHYIAQWRMLRAAQLLKGDRHSLAEISLAVGYESEAAFSKAFKRWAGQAPGSYRRGNRNDGGPATQMLAG
ncbi:MAG TPA: AraC family transcriptional regulator [Polyangiaceae bacterium]